MPRSRSPIYIFSWFVGLLVFALLTAAVLSPLVFHLLGVFPIHRVFNRIAMAAFLGGAVLLLRRLSITGRGSLGFAAPPAVFLKAAGVGFAAGVGLLGVVGGLLFGLGIRTWSGGPGSPLVVIAHLLPAALLSGVAVGLIEETFFRGAMYGAIRERGSFVLAVALTSLLYSSVHFLGERFRIPAEQVDWRSGFVLLSNFFNAYRQPLAIIDGFIALTLVGALLAIVRERLGHIGASIGLHAGFVTVIQVIRGTSIVAPDHPMSFLVSHRDGIVGWLVVIMTALVLPLALKLSPRAKSQETSGA